MKCVMVINQDLPIGLIANTAAVLAVSLGAKIDGIVGEDVMDGDGDVHRGITQVPIAMLKGNNELIRSIRSTLTKTGGLYFVDFCDVAQQSKHYSDFKTRLQDTPADQLKYFGIAIYGPAQEVNSLTGRLSLLR